MVSKGNGVCLRVQKLHSLLSAARHHGPQSHYPALPNKLEHRWQCHCVEALQCTLVLSTDFRP